MQDSLKNVEKKNQMFVKNVGKNSKNRTADSYGHSQMNNIRLYRGVHDQSNTGQEYH